MKEEYNNGGYRKPGGIIFNVVDEEHPIPHSRLVDLFYGGKALEVQPVGYKSKVRIRFNRALTWSEREAFRLFVQDTFVPEVEHHFNNDDPSEVYLKTQAESRLTVEVVSEFVAESLLNVHPVAVKTIYPKTVV